MDELEHLQKIDIPLVVVGGHVEECAYIGIDDYAAASTAVKHLIELGHRDIALLHGDDETDFNFDVPRVRILAFQDVMTAAGLEVRPEWDEWGDFTVRSGQEAFRRLWAQPARNPPPSSAPQMKWPWGSSSKRTGSASGCRRTCP
jgi:LacI family repressor for deo operon, udp, cdd, tsx, nupC, and nupG